jgi:methoxymalonate biosynthesis acyl carrier protein
MHGKAQLAEKVREIFEKRLGIHVPGDDADLFAEGVVDSLSFINLLLHLESEFGITIPLERLDLAQFNTVDRIASFVARATGGGMQFAAQLMSSAG